MSLGGTKVDSIDVAAILGGVEEGLVVLPDFQRRFEWSESDTIAALATVLTKWPIGSLLLLEGAPGYLRTRPFQGSRAGESSAADKSRVEYVVLDGQQRITSLFHALWDRGPRVYVINIDSLEAEPSPENLEESIETFSRKVWESRFSSEHVQLAEGYVPIYALKTPSDFFAWRDIALKDVPEPSRTQQHDRIGSLYRELFSGLDRYRVPAIIVPRATPPGAIARIFERVNKTGMTLKTFDLMVAIAYDGNFNLRERWDVARKTERPLVGSFFGDDGMPALQVMSLSQRQSLRDSDVVRLPGSVVRDRWSDSIESLEAAAAFGRIHLALDKVTEAPHRTSLVLLATIFDGKPLDAHAAKVLPWYWGASFSGRYDVASNTRGVSDYRSFLESGELPVPPVTLVEDEILSATPRQRSSFARAFRQFLKYRISNSVTDKAASLTFGQALAVEPNQPFDISPDSIFLGVWTTRAIAGDGSDHEFSFHEREQLIESSAGGRPVDFVRGRLRLLAEALEEEGVPTQVVASSYWP